MNDVKLSLGKRTYTIACAEGEEDHLRHLGSMVDERLSAIGADLMGQTEAKKGKWIPRSPKRSKLWPNGWKNRPPRLRVRVRTPR